MTMNRPVENTENVAEARATHAFAYGDPDDCPRCMNCDCRDGGRVAIWPCGTDVPRETVHADGTVTPVAEEVAA